MTTQPSPLIENVDYVINDDGNLVFTSHYLLKRGHCCMSGCLNCPFGYTDKVDPNVPAEFHDSWDEFVPVDDENEDDD
ncbi:MAG: hypothetical protein H7336_05820 [Bacteriovorax sp.]|nr:hypothetical protein [Bacteriovorax sp.]